MIVLLVLFIGMVWMQGCDVFCSILLILWNFVFGFFIVYCKVILLMYGDVCVYYFSCFVYVVGVVQQYGVVKGVMFFVWCIFCCNFWISGGVDDVCLYDYFCYDLIVYGFVVFF